MNVAAGIMHTGTPDMRQCVHAIFRCASQLLIAPIARGHVCASVPCRAIRPGAHDRYAPMNERFLTFPHALNVFVQALARGRLMHSLKTSRNSTAFQEACPRPAQREAAVCLVNN